MTSPRKTTTARIKLIGDPERRANPDILHAPGITKETMQIKFWNMALPENVKIGNILVNIYLTLNTIFFIT